MDETNLFVSIERGELATDPLTGRYIVDENGMPVLANIRQGYQDENGNIHYYESTTTQNANNLIADLTQDAFTGLLFMLLIWGCIAIVVLYLKWLFIRSAVESGVQRAVETILKNYKVVNTPKPPETVQDHPWIK